jgi:NTE family protein
MTPVKDLLLKYVDFSQLKASPIRLLIQAVDVQTGTLTMFDSYIDDITPEHVMASGSLPPAFAWTSIGQKNYWDAGIVSNSPLEDVLARCGSAGKRVFVIDLFPGKRRLLPQNIADVIGRRDEIVYAERIHSDWKMSETVRDYQSLVEEIVRALPAEEANRIQHQPRFIQLMGAAAPLAITRIVREHSDHVPFAKGYDFSLKSIEQLIQAGYRMAKKVLGL